MSGKTSPRNANPERTAASSRVESQSKPAVRRSCVVTTSVQVTRDDRTMTTDTPRLEAGMLLKCCHCGDWHTVRPAEGNVGRVNTLWRCCTVVLRPAILRRTAGPWLKCRAREGCWCVWGGARRARPHRGPRGLSHRRARPCGPSARLGDRSPQGVGASGLLAEDRGSRRRMGS